MFQPSTVLLEFLTWFAWLICFGTIQGRICDRFPEIRGVCRKAYVCTMLLPIGASAWLMTHSGSGSDLFATLNHAFGAGVFVQTFLRALVLLKWLALSGLPHRALAEGGTLRALAADSDVVALAGVLVQAIRKPDVVEPIHAEEAEEKAPSKA